MASAARPDPVEAGASALAAPASGLRVVEYDAAACRTPQALQQWEALVQAAAEPNPFFEPWYLLPSLDALDPAGRVRLLVAQDGAGAWLGLVPLAHDPRYYGRPVPNWRGWVHANAFLGVPLVARGREAAFWRALLAHIDRTPGLGLFLHLTALPIHGPVTAGLAAVCTQEGRSFGFVHREERALLASDLDAAAYFETAVAPRKRKELRRQHARLSELGALTCERTRDPEGVRPWADAFLALEQRGWKGAAGSALACSPGTAKLFIEALTQAARRGRLERVTLSLAGKPIAMLATFLAPPGAFAFKTAFDERYARYSPGVLLQRENLALLNDPGLQWCDSCAAADHPMIDHIWRERRAVGRVSVAIGPRWRRALFNLVLRAEQARASPSATGRVPDGASA